MFRRIIRSGYNVGTEFKCLEIRLFINNMFIRINAVKPGIIKCDLLARLISPISLAD